MAALPEEVAASLTGQVKPIDLFASPEQTREPLPLPTGPLPSAESSNVSGRTEPAVVVQGIECSRGHFNHPQALYCSVCGISTVHQTRILLPGPRPSLGILVVDDGSTFSLDGNYVIGRAPEVNGEVGDGHARPMVVNDDEHLISRAHAEVQLKDWDVVVDDLGSANGTFAWNPGDAQWTRLSPNQDFTLAPGGRVAVGRRTLVYESHHKH